MSFNFPDNPTAGQIFEPTAGVVYIWQSPVWKRYVPPLDEGEAGIEEAPINGVLYSRADAAWTPALALPIPSSGVTGLDTKQASQDAAITARLTDAPSDGLTYGRKDLAWATVVGGAVISDTPPPGPLQAGQLWYEADSGNTYIWYSDADSSQWVQINIQPVSPTSVPPGLTAERRNRVVNPAMQISQELAKNTSWSGQGAYLSDQWALGVSTGGTQYGASYPPTVSSGDPDIVGWLRLGCSTADVAVAAGDYVRVYQAIEGTRVYDFKWGSATAKQVVLRFRARSSILGTFSVALQVAGSTFAKNFTFTQVNTWADFSVAIPPLTTGTFVMDNTLSMSLMFTIMAGATYLTPTEGWNSGGFLAAPGISNWMSVAAQTFDLANVGLYLDPLLTGVAPRFEMPDEAQELQACLRYWERLSPPLTYYNTVAGTLAGISTAYGNIPYLVRKRVAPAGTSTGTQYYNTGDGFIAYTPVLATLDSTLVYYGSGMTNWKAWTQAGSFTMNARM